MGLRKGNVEANVAAAVDETPPPFDTKDAPPVVTAAPAPAPAPAPVETAPVAQEQAATAVAAQAAPAPAPVAVANPPTQLPATRTQGATSLTTSGVQGDLANQGFDGLDFGFGSFPVITLQNDGTFQSSEGGSLGTDFYCCVLGSTPKWIYKNDQKGPAEDFFYTFDRQFSVQGESIEDILAGWVQKGWKHEIKKYLDVQAQLVSQDEDNGTLVLLSIPPTSISKFSGYLATVTGRHNKQVQSVVTHIKLGEKVTKVKYPFHPWAFAFHGDMTE
jgi:hypothetical protein